jgi:hypothetical protein
MSVESVIYSALTANTNVSAIVSTRVYPMVAPRSAAMPLLTYERASTDEIGIMSGVDGALTVHLSVDCWGTTYLGARSAADAVEGVLNGYSNTASDPVVIMVRREGERDIVEPPEAAEDKPLFRVSQDWAIEHA